VPSLVLPEHRPTLRDELARHSRGFRWSVLGLLAALVIGFAAWALAPKRAGAHYVHRSQPVFNLHFGDAFQRLAPERDEVLHIRRRAHGRTLDAFAVSPLTLPPYRGDVGGLLPVYAERVLADLRVAYPDLELVEEGKARVGLMPAYSILFRVGRGRDRMYGRDVVLPRPQPGAREAVRLALRTWKGSGVSEPRDLGFRGALRAPYRTFRFGTADA
jgi:hypothetical protein